MIYKKDVLEFGYVCEARGFDFLIFLFVILCKVDIFFS